jgi:acyl-CoA thioesterase-1
MMFRPAATSVWLSLMMVSVACGGAPVPAESPAAVAPVPAAAAAPAVAPTPAVSAPVPAARRIVVLGDSLTAGLGLPEDQAYPALLQARLDARDNGWQVVNAGVSGDTSAGGLRRLDWSLDGGAAIVVIALGGNDALRGLPAADLERNLDEAVQRAQSAGARVIVAGMEAPPNTGPDYTQAFRAVYPAVARRRGAALVPFLLDGVAGIETLNQADGIHPNQAGARLVADTVWRVLEPVVRDLEAIPTR